MYINSKSDSKKSLFSRFQFSAQTLSFPKTVALCGIFAVVFQILTEFVRQNSIFSALVWIPLHFLGFLYGTTAVFFLLCCFSFLFRRIWISAALVGFLLFAGSYASFFKQAYRGDPVLPADILLAKDAAGVAGGMDLSPTPYMILFAVLLILGCFAVGRLRLSRFSLKGAVLPVFGFAAAVAVWVPCTLWFGAIPEKLGLLPIAGRATSVYNQGGFTTGFLSYLGHISPKKPSGYSETSKQAAFSQLPPQKTPVSTPDIVVVMMESYYHLDNYPTVTGCETLTQNYDALAKEGISGTYYSDKYSGGTADMEFGALTGFSTSFLPEGTVPYIQYVSNNLQFPSYPSYLKSLGYRTVAIHPFDGTIYHRNEAYPNMGFDIFLDRETMTYTETQGKYIADSQAAQELISQYISASADGSPVFLHMVTMQNHIPNLPEEYAPDYRVDANMAGVPEYYNESLKSVATGLRDADAMMKQITDYFRTVDREVIVLFFGDHQTAIGQEDGVELLDVTGQLNGLSPPENWQATHKVPYLMWSNKGCENAGSDAGSFPPYLLLPTFLTEMNAPITPWFDWLYQSRSTLMGTSAGYFLQPDATVNETATDEQKQLLNTQHTLQYAMMFDGGVPWD